MPELKTFDDGSGTPEPTRRETIEAVVAQLSGEDKPAQPQPAPTPAAPTAQPQEPAPPIPRDPQGRFAPEKPPSYLKPQPQRTAPIAPRAFTPRAPLAGGPTPAPEMPAAALKAPASWTPAAREAWNSLNPQVQAEIHRRETDNAKLLQESANDRQLAAEFRRVAQPFTHVLAMEGANPAQAFEQYLRTVGTLRMGTPHEKAINFAGLIQRFGIDVSLLDAVLAAQMRGQPVQQPQNQPQQQFFDPRVDQMLARADEVARGQMQEVETQAAAELEPFRQAEFYEDLKHDMADFLEQAAGRGRVMSVQEAYQRAALAHPEINQILQNRAQAHTNTQRTSRARAASVSLSSAPHAPVGTTPSLPRPTNKSEDRRNDILTAIATLQGR